MASSTDFQNVTYCTPVKNFYVPNAMIVRSEITFFASKANSFAEQILGQNRLSAYSGPVIVHHEPSYPLFWHPNRVVVAQGSSCSNARTSLKKKDNSNLFIGVIAAVIGAVAIYSLGSSIASYQDASLELKETNQFQLKLMAYQDTANDEEQDLVYCARQAASLKEHICSRIKNSAASDIFLRTFLLGSCGSVVTGVVMNAYALPTFAAAATTAPALITCGAIAGCVTTAGMLFKWGFDSTDKANMRDAQSLKDSVYLLESRIINNASKSVE